MIFEHSSKTLLFLAGFFKHLLQTVLLSIQALVK